MKVKKMVSIGMVTLLAATSCKTILKSSTADFDYLNITKMGIIQKPMITDLQVAKEKVTISRSFGNIGLKEAKENTMGAFTVQEKCDLIVQPYFTTTSVTENDKTTITVNLTGYPAFYKNIRNFQVSDSSLFFPGTFKKN